MKNSYNKDTDLLLSIFSSDEFAMEEEGLADNLRKIAKYYDKNGRHQYHIISHFVYMKMNEGEDIVSYILNNIESMLTFISYRKSKCEKIVSKNSNLHIDDIVLDLEKLYDHIALEEERLINNGNVIQNSKNEIERNVINTFNNIIDNFQNKVDEVSNSLNANIITVVGLFSAIIFVFFGGAIALSELINGILKLKEKDDLTLPLIVLLTVGFILFNIIFLLLYSVSKIVDKNIGCSVSYPNGWWYHVEEDGNGKYSVYRGVKVIKEFEEDKKAQKYMSKRMFFSQIRGWISSVGKRIFLRFPYVFIINVILISGIIYLYMKL